jgi:hypothetical protein
VIFPAAGSFTAAQAVNHQAASGAAWSVREAK